MHDRRSECSVHGRIETHFMGLSFASADTFRRSLMENCILLPPVMSKRGGPSPGAMVKFQIESRLPPEVVAGNGSVSIVCGLPPLIHHF